MDGTKNVISGDEPVDRLTRLADVAIRAIEEHPEATGKECGILLLADSGKGGSVSFGFDENVEVLEFMLLHAEAMFKASGLSFQVIKTGMN